MNFGDIIILLARQRSGTNALRSVLETHADIYCHDEVFSITDRNALKDPQLRPINYFNFIRDYSGGDIERILPDQHEKLFIDFLEYLRCFSSKRYVLIDVKYNNAHFLTEPYKWNMAPYLFYLIRLLGIRVINLRRQNYLRFVVSTVKAEQSNVWVVDQSDKSYRDHKVHIDIDYLMRWLSYCDAENTFLDGYFSVYGKCLTLDYDAVFPKPNGAVARSCLRTVAEALGIPPEFEVQPAYKKQSYLPLEETVENFDEVAASLRNTKFEYCLEDEQMYRKPANGRARRGDAVALEHLTGVAAARYCDALVHNRPAWVAGSLTHADARFLFERAIAEPKTNVLEVGTASGFGTTVLSHALNIAAKAGTVAAGYRVVSCDSAKEFYADAAKQVGDAAREQLPADLLAHVEFLNPATAFSAARHFNANSLDFAFIDANHKHPWPALDFLAILEALVPGAEVVLHDINLPVIHPEFPHYGAKVLFDELELLKHVPQDAKIPNIGSVIVPADKADLRRKLLAIVHGHEWQAEIPVAHLKALGIEVETQEVQSNG